MDGEEDEVSNDDEVVENSSSEENNDEDEEDDDQGFLRLNGWLLLDRESIAEGEGGIVPKILPVRPYRMCMQNFKSYYDELSIFFQFLIPQLHISSFELPLYDLD